MNICKTLKYSNQSDNSLRVLRFDRLIVDWSFENMNPILFQCGMSLDDSVSSEDKNNRYNKVYFDWSDIVINQYKKNF
jgi:hypothetical protein